MGQSWNGAELEWMGPVQSLGGKQLEAKEMIAQMIAHKRKAGIPLLPRHGIYLNKFGYGNDERFAEQFKLAWKMIPLGARRVILKHWRHHFGVLLPTIGVLNYWSGQKKYDPFQGETVAFGQCGFQGFELRFYAPIVDAMPDDILRILIVHELKHVHTFAYGKVPEEADDVWEMTVRWGVDNDLLDAWIEGPQAEEIAEKFWAEWGDDS